MAKAPKKEDNIRSAVALLITTDNPEQWEADGSPKLAAIQDLVGADVTAEDVALAAPEGGFKRPAKEEPASPLSLSATAPVTLPEHPHADPQDDAREEGLGDGTLPTATAAAPVELPEPVQIIRKSQAAIKSIEPELAEVVKTVEAAGKRLQELQAIKNQHIERIEAATEKVTQAEAVRRVQAQTQKNALEQKQRTQLAATALKASGFQVHASPLDAAMANRKRTPESVQNQAKHVHQRAKENLERRLGTV